MERKINVHFEFDHDDILSRWIKQIALSVLNNEGVNQCGSLSVILVSDGKMKEINQKFLNKNVPTDVMAFQLDEKDEDEWGEVYISLDRAHEQAKQFATSWKEELARYVIHGVLHLLGYDDKTSKARSNMRQLENQYLDTIILKKK